MTISDDLAWLEEVANSPGANELVLANGGAPSVYGEIARAALARDKEITK